MNHIDPGFARRRAAGRLSVQPRLVGGCHGSATCSRSRRHRVRLSAERHELKRVLERQQGRHKPFDVAPEPGAGDVNARPSMPTRSFADGEMQIK